MTATTSDEAALCAAIRCNPDENTPRLVYADWLEENPLDVTVPCPKCENSGEPGWRHRHGKHGPGYYVCEGCADIDNGDARGTGTATVRDESRRVRAELIRVQVELAKVVPWAEAKEQIRHELLVGRLTKDQAAILMAVAETSPTELERRESALAARLAGWPGVLPRCPRCGGERVVPTVGIDGDPDEIGCECFTGRVGSWVRGMLAVPVPTRATVFATDPHGFDFEGPDVGVDWSGRNGFPCCCRWAYSRHGDACPEHGKKGKPLLSPWARTELLARPWVCEVPILDREPLEVFDGVWCWSRQLASHDEPHRIPDFIFDRMSSAERVDHRTPAAARTALARATAQAAFNSTGG